MGAALTWVFLWFISLSKQHFALEQHEESIKQLFEVCLDLMEPF